VKNYINNDALWDKKVSKPAYFEQKKDNQEADLLIEKFADKVIREIRRMLNTI
jgi:hypothetical protein